MILILYNVKLRISPLRNRSPATSVAAKLAADSKQLCKGERLVAVNFQVRKESMHRHMFCLDPSFVSTIVHVLIGISAGMKQELA